MCAHVQCRVHFFHHVEFYFRLRQQISFPVWGQLRCACQGEELNNLENSEKKYCIVDSIVFIAHIKVSANQSHSFHVYQVFEVISKQPTIGRSIQNYDIQTDP